MRDVEGVFTSGRDPLPSVSHGTQHAWSHTTVTSVNLGERRATTAFQCEGQPTKQSDPRTPYISFLIVISLIQRHFLLFLILYCKDMDRGQLCLTLVLNRSLTGFLCLVCFGWWSSLDRQHFLMCVVCTHVCSDVCSLFFQQLCGSWWQQSSSRLSPSGHIWGHLGVYSACPPKTGISACGKIWKKEIGLVIIRLATFYNSGWPQKS